MSLEFYKFFKDIDKLKNFFDKNFIKEIEVKLKLFSNRTQILSCKKFDLL